MVPAPLPRRPTACTGLEGGDHRGSAEACGVVQYVGKEEVPSYCLSRANEGEGGEGTRPSKLR